MFGITTTWTSWVLISKMRVTGTCSILVILLGQFPFVHRVFCARLYALTLRMRKSVTIMRFGRRNDLLLRQLMPHREMRSLLLHDTWEAQVGALLEFSPRRFFSFASQLLCRIFVWFTFRDLGLVRTRSGRRKKQEKRSHSFLSSAFFCAYSSETSWARYFSTPRQLRPLQNRVSCLSVQLLPFLSTRVTTDICSRWRALFFHSDGAKGEFPKFWSGFLKLLSS